jgi:hypothetical protein
VEEPETDEDVESRSDVDVGALEWVAVGVGGDVEAVAEIREFRYSLQHCQTAHWCEVQKAPGHSGQY